MGLTSQPQPFYYKSLPGMNNKVEPHELGEQYVEVAQNCRFEIEPGTVSKREPISYYNTSAISANPIMGLYRFYRSDGTTKFVTACANKVYVGDDATGTFAEIRTLTTTGKRMKFVTYKDILIGGNGYDSLFCYDGSVDNITWELGSCKAKVGTGTGITRTDISYKLTWDDNWFVPGAVSNTIATVTNKNILLSNIPLGPVGTTNRKIYRKSSETGGNYRLIATLSDNITTTYTDGTADASAGTAYPAVTDSIPKGADLAIYRERLFVTRNPTAPNVIYYSDPYTPHYIQKDTQLMYLEISPEDNDEIMGIPVVMGNILCIKKNTIRKIFILGPTGNWYAEDPFSFSGSPAPWSICQTPYGIMYLGWDHWYLYDGSNAQPWIDEFDTYSMLPANYYDVVSFWDNTEFLAAYTDSESGSRVHDRVMRYNFKRKALSYETLKVNCFASKIGDQETGELYYGSSQTGLVYKSVNEDLLYKLYNKTQCSAGTKTNTFVGGTESAPYIEIGSVVTAQAIPNNICIIWDSESYTPGSGWTEITDKNERYIFVDSSNAPGTTSDSVGISGTTFSNFTSRDYRIFKKNGTTTEYQFPDGAIIIWDQTTPPIGFVNIEAEGIYLTINSSMGADVENNLHDTSVVQAGTAKNIENVLKVYLVKKVGEADTWDGFAYYCYALYYDTAAPGNGWTDVTATYTNHYLQSKNSGAPETVEGANTTATIDWVQSASHVYTGGGTGANGHDGDFSSSQETGGNGPHAITATHWFSNPVNITDVKYRLAYEARAYGDDHAEASGNYKLEYTTDGTTWVTIVTG